MDDQALRTCICETGRELLENGLVARTWGNVSARADGGHYLVTPSGMDYGSIAPEDIALCDLATGKNSNLPLRAFRLSRYAEGDVKQPMSIW